MLVRVFERFARLPVPGIDATAAANGCLALFRGLIVHDIVIAFPTGRLVAVHIKEQHHPVAVRGRSELFSRTDMEVDIFIVPGDLGSGDVIASAAIHIMDVALSESIPVPRVALVG